MTPSVFGPSGFEFGPPSPRLPLRAALVLLAAGSVAAWWCVAWVLHVVERMVFGA